MGSVGVLFGLFKGDIWAGPKAKGTFASFLPKSLIFDDLLLFGFFFVFLGLFLGLVWGLVLFG